MFAQSPPQMPNFELEFSAKLSKKVYSRVIGKIFAMLRHLLYKEVRRIVRGREDPKAGTYLTKNETR